MFIVVRYEAFSLTAQKTETKKEAWKLMKKDLINVYNAEEYIKRKLLAKRDVNKIIVSNDSAYIDINEKETNYYWQIFEIEYAPFILVECIESKMSIKTYETIEDARNEMKNALLTINYGEFAKAYDRDKDENGFVDYVTNLEYIHNYAIVKDRAWANSNTEYRRDIWNLIDGYNLFYDWQIFAINEI